MSVSKYIKKIGCNIALIRKNKNISLDILSQKTKIKVDTLKKIEAGNVNNIKPDNLLAIAKALGVLTDEIVGEL